MNHHFFNNLYRREISVFRNSPILLSLCHKTLVHMYEFSLHFRTAMAIISILFLNAISFFFNLNKINSKMNFFVSSIWAKTLLIATLYVLRSRNKGRPQWIALYLTLPIGQNHFEGPELNDELERFGDWRRRRRKS